ncbi:MAG: HisA/HisF-related TIM barrel protein [Planctomycetota bacterium]|nr:HisA/HisF-related TIM barrel protein [Planctomycetota bacterium]MEE3285916.1 HisA/HisF-related TIM barrel protein [Planctomycetota bacterium]
MTPRSSSPAIEIIPVLDLMHGQIVRGIAGQRESYRPISSCLVDSAKPLDVADAFLGQPGLQRIYLADLDAIQHDQPDWDTVTQLAAGPRRLLVDAGLQDSRRASELIRLGVESVVAGLETLSGPGLLSELVDTVGDDRLVFSLDMTAGTPMTNPSDWPDPTPTGLAETAIAVGVRRLIVLDLAGVGTGGGPPTLELCQQIRNRHHAVELITGGGIRNHDDIAAAAAAGVDAVLVASALHDGSLLA